MNHDPVSEFFQAAANAGIPMPEHPIADGELHRFKTDGDREDNSWYVLHGEGVPSGAFGCWKRGFKENWHSTQANELGADERRQLRKARDHKRVESAATKERTKAKARLRAADILKQSVELPIPDTAPHSYLSEKKIKPYGIYLKGNSLVIPIRNSSKVLTSLQFISEGKKRFLSGGEIIGCYHVIGNKLTDRLLIAEGYATGASLHEATGSVVAVAFYADNLKPVAKALREKFPDIQIILCADNDVQTEGNPGITKATEAAQKISGLLATPKDGGDFNDTATTKGLETVSQIIDAATTPPRTNDAIVQDAASMDDITYDQKRDALAKELNVRAATLDTQRKKARKESVEDEAPILVLNTPEPCADSVDGVELLNEIVATFNEYLVLPEGAPEAMALWTLHTYCHEGAWISPLLIFSSPTKQCGKTTCLTLLGSIVNRPLPSSNATAPTLFRGIDKHKPTLLLDEADTFLKDDEAMRGIINSGHNRSSAFALRLVGDDYDVKSFSTWCPKTIAAIGKLPATLMDRAIVVVMQRKKNADKVKRLRGDKLYEFESLRRQCARWALDNLEAIKATDPDVPEYLGDRAQDNWRTLLAIAEVAGWREVAVAAIKHLVPEKTEDDDNGVKLLADIKEIFGVRECVSSADIVVALNEIEESPWPGFFHGKGISAQYMATMLGKYGIKPKTHRSLGSKRGYKQEQFLDSWGRYLPETADLAATTLQRSDGGASSDSAGATDGLGVAPGNGLEPPLYKGCSGVAPQMGVLPDSESTDEDIEQLREAEAEYLGVSNVAIDKTAQPRSERAN